MDFLEYLKSSHNISLNPQQEQAVLTINGAILLLAVPGSGKTTVIITRLGNMIFNYAIPPENILNITFSRASARDMKHRFSKIFGNSLDDRLEFRTIHSFCLMVLKDYYQTNNMEIPKIIEDNFILIKKIYIGLKKSYVGDEIIKEIIQKISYCTNMLLSNDEIKKIEVAGCDFPEILKQYDEFKFSNKQIDFDDMLRNVYEVFMNYPKYLEKYQDLFRYINLDEAQDTSFLQHEIIRLLAQKYRNLFMVGDEDQSIYGFRAAFPKALLNFNKTYANSVVLKMERNYRSTKVIVDSANMFIKQNKERINKNMFCENEIGLPINFVELEDLKEQYSHITKKVKTESGYKSISILYRNNDSAIPLVDIFDRENIQFSIRENTPTFFTHFVTNDILSFIRLANNFGDVAAFERIYYRLNINLSRKMFEYVKQNSNGDVFETLKKFPELSSATIKSIEEKKLDFNSLKSLSPTDAISYIEHDLNYNSVIKNLSKQGFSFETLMQKLNTLKIIASNIKDQISFIDRVYKLKDIMENIGINNSKITLSTVHSSKGLEFDMVFIIDAIDGQFPTTESIRQKIELKNSSQFEEETRLFYVGITRARKELTIFISNKLHGQKIRKSRFIDILQFNKNIDFSDINYNNFSNNTNRNQVKYYNELKDYSKGDYIIHTTFGNGKIVNISGKIAEIQFNNKKIMKFDLKLCNEKGIIRLLKSS